MTIHVVAQGETAYTIALKYGIQPKQLINDNEIPNPDRLVTGQTLVILYPKTTHIVKQDETLLGIALQYEVTINTLYRNNIWLMGLPNITVGDVIVIEYLENIPRYTAVVNGYAYPYISRSLLRQTLPYSGYLTPFTYGFKEDGTIITIMDEALIATAKEYGVKSLMHLSTLTNGEMFSNELASVLLNDIALQDKILPNILAEMEKKGFEGLDIDFEFILEKDRDLYSAFLKKTTVYMNAKGYPVISALAPKTSADQQGDVYVGHDYGGIGSAVNAVLVMTYEWGYTYGPPLAVAPINNVKAVLDYAVTEIPSKKILLGFPNYGYDWTLPYVKGESRATSISNVRAIEIAGENNVAIQFDSVAMSPHFNYIDENGKEHEVWFEDARSAMAKLSLIREYQLLGVGYWNFMRPFPQNWLVLNSDFLVTGEVPF